MESPNCQSGDESLSQKFLVNEVVSEEELSNLPFPNEDERRSALLLVHVWSRAYRIARGRGWQDVDCEDIAQETLIKFLLRVHFKGTIEHFTRRKVSDIKSRHWGLRKKRREISFSQRDGFDIEERAMARIRKAEVILEWLHLNSSLRRFKMLYECYIDGYSRVEIAARHELSLRTVLRDIDVAMREIQAKFGDDSND